MSEHSQDEKAERLVQLSEDVGRIARALAELSLDPTDPAGQNCAAVKSTDAVPIARAILEDRKRRSQIFNPGMFGEPGWDLLLNLYVVDRDGPRLTIGKVTQLAGVSLSTSLRWLEYLKDQGLITREHHPTDARTAYVALTDKAREALGSYLSH